MKQKGNKSPRPRFHIIFAIEPITDPAEYTAFMKSVQQMYPFFDDNALDAARFFFGNPGTEVTFFEGNTTLTAFIEEESSERAFAELGETIAEGSRNNTMSLFAGKLLKRLGDTNEAHSKFLERAESCTPPLEDGELETIWQSARKFYKKVCSQPGYVAPEEYNAPSPIKWEIPIPFEKADLPSFPTEALPKVVRDYVTAVAESTQTPVDMSASAALAILALCEQGKFRIRGKADWTEPLNLFVVVVAEPSERKSAVISLMTRPVNAFEADYNRQNAAELETSKMNKRILERRQRALEDKAAKGKIEDGELEQLAQQLATYKERTPLRLYVDDVTTEKLTAVLADGGGKAAIVSAEGGIFDMLSGIYSKNVNIDVMLKGHSGDSNGFLESAEPLVVDEPTMANAIKIGRYYTEHSSAAFSLMGADALVKQSEYMLDAICKSGLTEFTRRDIMRLCRSFKTADEVQPVLNHLAEYGYIVPKTNNAQNNKGRPTGQAYLVNPYLYEKAS